MKIQPFFKWAGNKFRLLDKILPALPEGSRLVEPFAGSGAVYLNTSFTQSLLCDVNQDLICFYETLRREGSGFIQLCRSFFIPENNVPERFYELRAAFNSSGDPVLRSALFLYLNRHAFNGLVRYNAKGGFNVPFGRYKQPFFPQESLQVFYHKTRDAKTEFQVGDFRKTFERLLPGDVVYCDPPYVPLSGTANFTGYAAGEFSDADQEALAKAAYAAGQRGITVVISNHDTPRSRELYEGALISSFPVRRFISCKGGDRWKAPELLAVYR